MIGVSREICAHRPFRLKRLAESSFRIKVRGKVGALTLLMASKAPITLSGAFLSSSMTDGSVKTTSHSNRVGTLNILRGHWFMSEKRGIEFDFWRLTFFIPALSTPCASVMYRKVVHRDKKGRSDPTLKIFFSCSERALVVLHVQSICFVSHFARFTVVR